MVRNCKDNLEILGRVEPGEELQECLKHTDNHVWPICHGLSLRSPYDFLTDLSVHLSCPLMSLDLAHA